MFVTETANLSFFFTFHFRKQIWIQTRIQTRCVWQQYQGFFLVRGATKKRGNSFYRSAMGDFGTTIKNQSTGERPRLLQECAVVQRKRRWGGVGSEERCHGIMEASCSVCGHWFRVGHQGEAELLFSYLRVLWFWLQWNWRKLFQYLFIAW